MQGKLRRHKGVNELSILFLEVGLKHTKAIQAVIGEHAQIARKFHIERPFLSEIGGEIKINAKLLRNFLAEHFPSPGEIVLVIDSSVSLRLIEKVPPLTETSIHEHIRQSVAKTQKIDLASYFWTVVPLGQPKGEQMSAAAFEQRSAIVSATKKDWLERIQAELKSGGWKVSHVLFQQACMMRAFQLFGGAPLGKETVGLLHFSQSHYSLSILQNGVWISHRDGRVNGTAGLKNEVKTHLAGLHTKQRIRIRCMFVSVDGTGAELLANELKEVDCYARAWNALRRVTLDCEKTSRDSILSGGAHYNSLVGAMLMASDFYQRESEKFETTLSERLLSVTEKHLVVPMKIAACLALLGSGYFWELNSRAKVELAKTEQKLKGEKQQFQKIRGTKDSPEKRVAELELFRESRKFWPGVLTQIRNLNIEGIQVLQVKISDTLMAPEVNPFQTEARSDRLWRISGTMIVEAKNNAGLNALENFMTAVKSNGYIRPLLHKKKPVRVLNDINLAENVSASTLFTLEYPFQDQTL